MKVCPFCAEDVQDAAIVCKHCGRDIPLGAAPPIPPATVQVASSPARTPAGAAWAVTIIGIVATFASAQTAIVGMLISWVGFAQLLNGGRARRIALAFIPAFFLAAVSVAVHEQAPTSADRTSPLATAVRFDRAVTPERVIAEFGSPDIDDSSEHDHPRPPIVARILRYNTAGVNVIFTADAKMNEPPPYRGWLFIGYADATSNQPITGREAVRRAAR